MNVKTQGNIIIPAEELVEQGIEAFYTCDAAQNTKNFRTNIALIDDNNTSNEEPIPEVIYQVIAQSTIEDLDKDKWNHFWRLFNLLNLGNNEVMKKGVEHTEELTQEVNINEILENYPGVEDIARYLLEHQIDINPDGGFELLIEDEVLGSAMLGSEEYKFVVEPFDNDSKRAFDSNGYTVVDTNDLETIKNMIQ